MDHDDNPSENGENHIYQTETFVFTGNGGPAILATMHNLMNRIIHGQQQQPVQQEHHEQQENHGQQEHEQQEHYGQEQREHLEQPQSDDPDMRAADDPSIPDLPPIGEAETPPLEPFSNADIPGSRPIRPLPRPHAHFHAHTPGGIIDLFTFNVAGPPPTPPPGTATFTFNLGPDVLAGFEAFFLGGMQKDREPDPERAKVLLKGMEAVPEGLVRRLERAGGVPGGQGQEESAGCSVCWGPLLDEIEPGEWDTAKEKEEKATMAADGKEKSDHDDSELHGRIVALPCAHVYHAECLLPWFSRNTTCPMCRFDVDPESLTWTPRLPASGPPPLSGDDMLPEVPSEAMPPPPGAQDPNAQTEQHRRANLTQTARYNAWINHVFRVAQLAPPFGHTHPHPPAPPGQSQEHPQQAPQPQQQPQPQPQLQPQPQSRTEPPVFPSPHLPPPNSFVLPPPFRMPMPFFVMPPHAQPDGAGGHPTIPIPYHNPLPQNIPSPPPPPPPHTLHTRNHVHPFADHLSADEVLPNIPHGHPQGSSPPLPPRRERIRWTPPEPVGKTLRQRVEEKERELGLRCDDMVCGVAPSDDDPTPLASQSGSGTKRIIVRGAYDSHGKACEHSFHPACLVTSARVAGVTGDDDELQTDDGNDVQEGELQVACPACRAIGSLKRTEWDEGVRASEAEMA